MKHIDKAIGIVTLIAMAGAFLAGGCVGTTVPTPYGRAYRLAVFQSTEASMSWRGTNQVFELSNYKNAGDAAFAAAVTEAAVKAGVSVIAK